jgi:D-alanyl-lipoteichoic acid acyltransferase DltB (MBOAT superfamily)
LILCVLPSTLFSRPISFYNAWASYINRPQTEWDYWKIAKELIKLILYYIVYEVSLHLSYVSAIAYNKLSSDRFSDYWATIGMDVLTAQDRFLIACHVGVLWWLKFLIIWRTFRVWVIMDGIYIPDNMGRCIYNMTFFKQFWRNWHITFYQWSLRYIYIPLSGEKTKYWNVWVLYTFIATWHDLWWRWFLWAIFNCCCIVIEAIIFWYLAQPRMSKILQGSPWITYLIDIFIRGWGIQVLALCQLSVSLGNDIFELIWVAYFGPGSLRFILIYVLPLVLPMASILGIFQSEYDRTYGAG